MTPDRHHPEPDAPSSDLAAAWHRLRCAPCRLERREVRELRGALARLPSPPAARRDQLLEAFRTRHPPSRGSVPGLGSLVDRVAGGARGWRLAAGALALSLLPALPPWAHGGGVGEVLPCWLVMFVAGLATAGGVLALARGALTRGALLACAGAGALAGNVVLILRCPDCFVGAHAVAAHASALLAALVVVALLRPRPARS